MKRLQPALGVWTLVILSLIYSSEQVDLTTNIDAGREECFFETGEMSKTLAIDFTVISASQGNLDINFQVFDPYNRPIISEFRKSESSHNIPILVNGVYRICFDNTFSTFSTKSIAFGISIESPDEAQWNDPNDVTFAPEETYDIQVTEIQTIMNRVRVHVTKITRLQEEFREVESRDRSTVEHNYERINFWSILNACLMIGIGVMQTIIVKGLFEEGQGISGKVISKVRHFGRSLKG